MTKNFLLNPGNQEFRALLERSKWTQSEAARQLQVSPGLVSQYLSGITRPSSTTLTLFRMLVEGKDRQQGLHPPPTSTSESLRESHQKLAEIAQADPQRFQTVRELIKMAHSHLPKKKGRRKRGQNPPSQPE